MKDNHKYRVSIYLGKELYNKLDVLSNELHITISSLAKILLQTGFTLGDAIERSITNGESKK